MAQHCALTRLTTLDVTQNGCEFGRKSTAQLNVRLAPLGARLVPLSVPRCAHSEAPLKLLQGGGARLDLACRP
jgi:hypothetical protein